MESKKQPVPDTTVTRDLSKLSERTGNIYETVMIISQRANQIAAEVKKELNGRLEEFSTYADTLEETFENREQIEISRYYERQPKPTLIAVKEFEEKETYYKLVEEPKD
ncbi:MAG: DNA-directed RNA polymerase subunit omega [Bacteroidales bacterium]|jgi:DNA-directed RNA polymerase subunit K/omega|nr:DNA-directed RNA polymerase subunit omega [Bacteroidales bacterium]MDD2824126.1 DNA-directed RNA polymerase subunit omega [Bacteroidales bacterium]MDD3099834.1 DNA-directed RNA polymerase subunit omega [Bacteroidales bacterium]MDD3638660.1 DNA-directed RNA polymerase subunit omega [Bacteroidales bacterium]MDD3943213.1 DNA-directed RNA polymerase subunit omega [Bacteroidales bacterium]